MNDEEEAAVIKDMFPPRNEKSDPWERYFIGLAAWGKDRVWTTIQGRRPNTNIFLNKTVEL